MDLCDTQPEGIRSINDALAKFVSRETLEGFTCSKTKQEVRSTITIAMCLLHSLTRIAHLKMYNDNQYKPSFESVNLF